MDNDLMARRLRPPSEPSRPQNGYAPLPEEPMPWAPDVDTRSDVPWDRPAAEAWPPLPDEPVAEARVEAEQQPVAEDRPIARDDAPSPWDEAADEGPRAHEEEAQAEPEPGAAAEPEPEPEASADAEPEQPPLVAARPTTWDDAPSPWDAPADENPQAHEQQTLSEPELALDPSASAEPEAEPEATDIAVTGRAPWDRPEPYAWDEVSPIDDRSPDMLGTYDDMIPGTEEMPAPLAAPVAEADPAAAVEHSAADPYDAFAPVLRDVDEPVAPTWPSWSPTASATAAPPEASTEAVPPPTTGLGTGPTPPDGLFAPTLTPEQVADEDQPLDSSTLTKYSTAAASSHPVVLRLELAIVEDTIRVRPLDGTRPVGPWVEVSGASGADDSEIDPFTPRHPEFEPRSQVAAPSEADQEIPPETPAVAEAAPADNRPEPVDVWGLPAPQPAAAEVRAAEPPAESWYTPASPTPVHEETAPPSGWDEPNPTAAWTLQPAPIDPLATLPAAQQPYAPMPPMAVPVGASDALTLARPVIEQPDLWFLSSEPEAFVAEESATAASSEPSRVMTVGLTVLMVIVVIGLVLAFLWLMTSLPILR